MRCNVNNEIKELKYMVWNGTQYGPDYAHDLLDDGLNKHDEFGNTIYTETEYNAAIRYLEECAIEDNAVNGSSYHEAYVFSD